MKFWLFLFALPFLLYAETIWRIDTPKPFELMIKIHPSQMTLGDSFEVEAEFHYPSSYHLDIDALIDQLIWSVNPLAPQWNILQSKTSILATEEGMQAQHLNVKILPLIAGDNLEISFLTLLFLSKEANLFPLSILTPIFSLGVMQPPPLAEPLSLASLIPLEPQFPLGLTQANRELLIDNPKRLEKAKEGIRDSLEAHTFPWLTLVVLIGGGGIGWTIYLTRDRWPKRSIKSVVALSPKEKINQDLQALQKHLLDQTSFQTYYAELGAVLLKALQIQLGRKTEKLTTEELGQIMRKQSSLSPDQVEEALSFLTEIDQIKFAGKKTSQEEARQIFQKIQKFIPRALLKV